MNPTLEGVIHGTRIELDRNPGVADGTRVKVLVEAIAEARESLDMPDQTVRVPWLTVAMSLATNLGSDVSSERPHDFSGRGDDWFDTP